MHNRQNLVSCTLEEEQKVKLLCITYFSRQCILLKMEINLKYAAIFNSIPDLEEGT